MHVTPPPLYLATTSLRKLNACDPPPPTSLQVDLKIHSYSADWLYQAVLTLFNEAVKRQVRGRQRAAAVCVCV